MQDLTLSPNSSADHVQIEVLVDAESVRRIIDSDDHRGRIPAGEEAFIDDVRRRVRTAAEVLDRDGVATRADITIEPHPVPMRDGIVRRREDVAAAQSGAGVSGDPRKSRISGIARLALRPRGTGRPGGALGPRIPLFPLRAFRPALSHRACRPDAPRVALVAPLPNLVPGIFRFVDS